MVLLFVDTLAVSTSLLLINYTMCKHTHEPPVYTHISRDVTGAVT